MSRLLWTTCLGLLLLCCTSCTSRKSSHRAKSNNDNLPISCLINSVTEHNGQTLIELPVGERENVSAGTFFRIYGPDRELIKGTVKVDEVLGPHRSLARLVGELLDRNQPLAVNDRAREIRDLGLLVRAAGVEKEARKEIEEQQEQREEEQDRFQSLREHYQRELKKLQDSHDSNIAILSQRHEREIQRLKKDHELALQRKDLERRADLAAMQASLKKDSQELLRSEQSKVDQKYRDMRQERNELDNQIQSLLKQQDNLKQRITALVDEIATTETAHQKSLRAEIESREVLEARIRQLENEIAGEESDTEIVLTNDANRGETILERLTRISEERSRALKANTILRTQMAEHERKLKQQEQSIANLKHDLSMLKGDNESKRVSLSNLQKLEKDLSQTKEALSAASLSKLETERALYDLAIRVMRLQENDDSLKHLKQRLRQQYVSEN